MVRPTSGSKGVNECSQDMTQAQQIPESSTVTVTWHGSNCSIRQLHHRYIFIEDVLLLEFLYLLSLRVRLFSMALVKQLGDDSW